MKYKDFIQENYDIFLSIFDKMKTGIWICDSKGEVIIVNNESVKVGGKTRDEVIGKNIRELVDTGYITESATLLTIESKKEEFVVEEMGAGGYCLCTSVPLFYKGELDLVICVERNISEIEKLKIYLSENADIKDKIEKMMDIQYLIHEKSDKIVTRNINMLHCKDLAIGVSKTDTTVMITGESGTGKEMIADLIHKSSRRSGAPFMKVNCAAIPESLIESELFGYESGAFTGANQNGKKGIFELANGGTVFLDEIGELPMHIQAKFLRVLQEREIKRIGGEEDIPIDVRLITATNRNLKKEVEEGNFREDLYYRLFVVPISVPPLRERREDIEVLTKYFLNCFNNENELNKTISKEALKVMEEYDWPGNVRELRNVVERTVVTSASKEISAFQVEMCLSGENPVLFYSFRKKEDLYLDEMVSKYEKQIIAQVYEECGSVIATAKMLHVDKSTISRKMKKYGL